MVHKKKSWTLITGTGRSGTSCFARLINACLPTRHMPGADFWIDSVNAGCEGSILNTVVLADNHLDFQDGMILKDPRAYSLPALAKVSRLPDFIFICFRSFELSSRSRRVNDMQSHGALQWMLEDGHYDALSGMITDRTQLLNDRAQTGIMMDTIWSNDIPHAILKYPDFVYSPDALYSQVSEVMPIDRGLFMSKHAEIMDPSKVHIK